MSELRACVEAAAELRARGATCLVATVVDVHGSSYRKPGARMVFGEERWLAGSVSGGCLERDVLAKGLYRTRDGRAQLTTYDAATDERAGSGCDGVIDVLVERATSELADPLHFAGRCLRDETFGVLITAFRSQRQEVNAGAHHALLANGETGSSWPSAWRARLHTLASTTLAAAVPGARVEHLDGVDVLVELIAPPLHLFVFGGAHDALPVVTLAKAVGWSVTVCEPHAQLSSRERFRNADQHLIGPPARAMAALQRCARPAAVVMAHHYDRDLAALEALLRARVPYVGVLGARNRASRLLEDLAERGLELDADTRARLHTPVGLAIGAESPQEIALSIVAQIQAQLARQPLMVTRAAPAELARGA
jgi:xanthine dehydrogenase accessory factor